MEIIHVDNQEPTDDAQQRTEADINAFTSRRIQVWRDDPKIMWSDVHSFATLNRISPIGVMSCGMRWITENVPLNRLLCRQRACSWTMAQADDLMRQNAEFANGMIFLLDAVFDFTNGIIETVALVRLHEKAKQEVKRCELPSGKHTKLSFIGTANKQELKFIRSLAILCWAKAVVSCCDPNELPQEGGSYFYKAFVFNIEYARNRALLDMEGDRQEAFQVASQRCWSYFRELGLLLRVPQC